MVSHISIQFEFTYRRHSFKATQSETSLLLHDLPLLHVLRLLHQKKFFFGSHEVCDIITEQHKANRDERKSVDVLQDCPVSVKRIVDKTTHLKYKSKVQTQKETVQIL